MNEGTVKYYGAIADKKERDPYGPDGSGRAVVVNGRGFRGATWQRFHPGKELTWVQSPADGKMYGLTPMQLSVYLSMKELPDSSTKVRSIAALLKVSPSTVSRAAVKLASFGLIAYLIARGRYGGIIVVIRQKADGLDRFQRVAKDKVREWFRKANERLSRMKFNVATRYSWREIEAHGMESVYIDSISATLKAPWTPEDLRDAGII